VLFLQRIINSDNPAYPAEYFQLVPSPLRRTNLVIQNNDAEDIRINLDPESIDANGILILKPNQTIAFDNYNGAFSFDGLGTSASYNVVILESFA